MTERFIQLRETKTATFYNSFSPSSKAALIFAIPFTLVDAVHFYTAGSAMVFSLPVVVLFYLLCGALASRIALQDGDDRSELIKTGAASGVKLWGISTFINTAISIIVGVSSLGLTLALGIPYLCFCAPILAMGGSFLSGAGAYLYGVFDRRINHS